MDYATFYKRFGASARTKNIAPAKVAAGAEHANLRPWPLPARSEIPAEFIRLCPWEVEYLFTVARRVKHGIIETGRFNGGSLFVMACAAPAGTPISSIDKSPRDDELLRSILAEHCPEARVDLIVGDSQRTKYPQIKPVDLLFIDGDHRYEGCMLDILNWYEHLMPNGHLVFHDSYMGTHGVHDAIVDFMAQHPELRIVQSPFIGAQYWHYPAGSIAHFIRDA